MSRSTPHFRRRSQRVIAVLSLAGFVAGHIGIPVVDPSGKDALGAYACRTSACSCRSAGCGQGCCCRTHREEKPAARGCCAAKSLAQKAEAADGWQLTLVPTIAARKCQGLDQLWMLLSAAAPVASPVTFAAELPMSPFSPMAAHTLDSCDLVPPTPPPKV